MRRLWTLALLASFTATANAEILKATVRADGMC